MSTSEAASRRATGAIVLYTLASVLLSLDMGLTAPMSVDLADHLRFRTTDLNLVFGAHAVGAASAGFVGAFVLDRVGRRTGFIIATGGVALGALLTASATGLASLVAARFVAGWFDCATSAIAGAVVVDEIPLARRGRAIGVASSISGVAAMLGIPSALYIARLLSVRVPFAALACLAITTAIFAAVSKSELAARQKSPPAPITFKLPRPTITLTYAIFGCEAVTAGLFAPFVVPYILKNLAYPRDRLEIMFLGIGVTAALAGTLVGWLTDRIGAVWTTTVGVVGALLPTVILVLSAPTARTIPFLLGGFVVASLVRNSGVMVLATRVPGPNERAQYTSAVQVIFHVGTAIGVLFASQLVDDQALGKLAGGERLIAVASMLTVIIIPLGWLVHRRLATEVPALEEGIS